MSSLSGDIGSSGCDGGRTFVPQNSFLSVSSWFSWIRSSLKKDLMFVDFFRQTCWCIFNPRLFLQTRLHFQQTALLANSFCLSSSLDFWIVMSSLLRDAALLMVVDFCILGMTAVGFGERSLLLSFCSSGRGTWNVVSVVLFCCFLVIILLLFLLVPHSSFLFMDGLLSLIATASMHCLRRGSPLHVPRIFTDIKVDIKVHHNG